MVNKLLQKICKTIKPVIASAMMVTMLGGPVSYAADNAITAELGDTYTIGAGYYDKATTISVPTLASQTPGTATAANILSGKTAWVGGNKVTGTIPSKAATTYNVSTSNQTIAASQYLSGAQTIRAVTTANISAGNIKSGVTVKVGDSADDDRIKGVAGTFTSASTVSSGQTAAAAAQILSGYSAWVDGAEVKGSIASKAAATYNTSTSDQTIAASQYLGGVQTIKAVKTSGISAANIKSGQVVKVGDANSATRIANVTGTFTSASTVSSGQTAAAAAQILSGYSAWVDGAEVKGSIASLAATTYNTSTSDQTISAKQYLSGAQTIKAVKTSGISAANIKSGQVIKVGDANSATRIANVTGTFTSASTVSSGQTAAAAAQILSGYSAWVDGAEVKGNIASKAATTYYPSTSDQTIAAKQYLSGAQTIKAVTTANITAANIKSGVTVKVGDSADDDRIKGVTGTFTSASTVSSGQTAAAAGQIRAGYSAWVNGAEVKGTIADKAAQTYTPGRTDQTIAANQFLNGTQTIKGDSNLIAANIVKGKTIFGVTGTYSSDATATAAQILNGKTAYINGEKVTGTLADKGNISVVLTSSNKTQTLPAGYYSGITVSTNVVESNVASVSYQIGHHHVGTSGTTSPNGCYTKAETREEKTGSRRVECGRWQFVSGDGASQSGCWNTFRCDGCGEYTTEWCVADENGGGWGAGHHWREEDIKSNVTRYYLDCGYEEGEHVRDSATVPTAENEKLLSATVVFQ